MTARRVLPTTVLASIAAAAAAITGCYGSLQLTPSDHATVLAEQSLDADHPALPGPYRVSRLYYGSGTDRRRPEYRDSVSIVTETVDASKLVALGGSASERNSYWGFTPKEFPINGRAWYPEGAGPFPLVLIVHGNHDMRDFSDPGYGYLGELLASRGYVFASVDMNFINGGIRNENDGRGWFLLKHIDAFKEFAADESTPFHGKIDFDRIALIGHSRGGEAVGHAAAFNRLSRVSRRRFPRVRLQPRDPRDHRHRARRRTVPSNGTLRARREYQLHGLPRVARRRRDELSRPAPL